MKTSLSRCFLITVYNSRRALHAWLLGAAIPGLGAPAAASAQAALPYTVFCDSATIAGAPDYALTEGPNTYFTAHNGGFNPPSLFSSGAYAGTRSLKISVPTTTTTDRFEYEWVQDTDPNAPNFEDGKERYWGFAFKNSWI
jgi:hypothetical protein